MLLLASLRARPSPTAVLTSFQPNEIAEATLSVADFALSATSPVASDTALGTDNDGSDTEGIVGKDTPGMERVEAMLADDWLCPDS